MTIDGAALKVAMTMAKLLDGDAALYEKHLPFARQFAAAFQSISVKVTDNSQPERAKK